MKRNMMVGVAVVAILGIAITMALINKSVLADNADDSAGLMQTNAVVGNSDTAVTQDPVANPTNQNFIDEDGDGVCDTCGNEPGSRAGRPIGNSRGANNFVDEDGDGVCDTCGAAPADGTGNQRGNGSGGSNFVDEDGDGVCDTCGNVPGTGTGNQNGNGAGGSNFVDLDGDGICDDCAPLAPADGTGNQYGRQGGRGGQGGQGQRGGGRWNN